MPARSPKKSPVIDPYDLGSPQSVAAFRIAAEKFTREATRTKKSALDLMVREGIVTKSGRLTKRYSGS